MKSHPVIMIYLLIGLLFTRPIFSQNSKNVSFLGGFSEGPCFAVASKDSIIYLGNGTIIDIVELKSHNSIEKKTSFVSKFLINDLELKGDILFAATDGGLYLINVSNITAPNQISFFPTEGNCTSLFIKDNFIYLVDDTEVFHIIDVSDPQKPNLISTFKPESAKNLTQICATDTLVYLCDSVGKLLIVNTKEKANPILYAAYDFDNKYCPTTIIIKNNYAYVGTVNRAVPSYLGKLITLEISDPKFIKQVYTDYIPGDWSSGGRDLIIKDSLLCLSYGSDVGSGVEIYNISDPASPKIINSVSYNGNNSIRTSGSYSISLANNNLFVSEGGYGLSVFSIVDFNHIEKVQSYETCNTVNDLFVDNNIIFAACGYSGFNTYDYTNINKIIKTTKQKNQKSSYAYNTSVFVNNGFTFLTNTPSGGSGFQIFNTQGINSYNEIGRASIEANKVIVQNDYAYIAARFYGFVVYDIFNLVQPNEIFSLPFDVSCYDIQLKENICFLAAATKGVYIFDITNPANPEEITRFQTDGPALGLAVKDSIVFVAEGSKGLRIFNYKNKTNNLLYNQGLSFLLKVRVEGNYLYLIDDIKGLVLYDVTDPFNPLEIGYYNLGKARANNIFIKNSMIYVSQGYYGFSIFKNDLSTSVDKSNEHLPFQIVLSQNYPNPFNPTTTIEYTIPQMCFVTITVYDVLGREIETLVNEEKQIGNYKIVFDGSKVTSGIYFYKLRSGNYIETKKMIFTK